MPALRAAKCWQTSLFRNRFFLNCFRTSVWASPDLSTNCTPTTKNQPHASALTENAINWLKRPKNIKILFEFFQIFQKFKNGKYGGLIWDDSCGTSSPSYFSDVRGPFRTPNPQEGQKMVSTKIVHTSETFYIFGKVNRLFTPQNRHALTFPDTQSNP